LVSISKYTEIRPLISEIGVNYYNIFLGKNYVQMLHKSSFVDKYNDKNRWKKIVGLDKYGRYEASFADKFESLLKTDTVLYDIGASYGMYSILAYSITKSRKIYCFESDEFTNYVLKRNNKVYCNSLLNIHNKFISNKTDDVSSISIDYFLETGRHPYPTLVKMDIEGYEYFAIQGMKNMLMNRARPIILMEYHYRLMRDKLKVDPEYALNFLIKNGYKLTYNGHHPYTAHNNFEVDEHWHDEVPNFINFAVLAIPGDS